MELPEEPLRFCCPHCLQPYELKERSYYPTDTYWSDGCMHWRGHVQSQYQGFQKCACGRLLFFEEMMHQHATRSNLSQKDLDANMKTWEPALEKLKELLSYLHPGIDPRQEFSIRMSAWHTYNHYWRRRERNKTKSGRSQYRFKKFSRFALWFERIRRSEWRLHRENMIKLMALFNESDPYQKLLKAEANRNYGNFKVCLNMLSTMPDSPLVEEMIRQAKRKNGLVFEAKEFKDESTELYWFVHNVVTNPTQTTPLLSIEKILINAKNGISKKEPPS